MTESMNMNIVLTQGDIVKELAHVRKEHLELNQHYIVQNVKEQKTADKKKVKESQKDERIETKEKEGGKGNPRGSGRETRKSGSGKSGSDSEGREKNIIDITI